MHIEATLAANKQLVLEQISQAKTLLDNIRFQFHTAHSPGLYRAIESTESAIDCGDVLKVNTSIEVAQNYLATLCELAAEHKAPAELSHLLLECVGVLSSAKGTAMMALYGV